VFSKESSAPISLFGKYRDQRRCGQNRSGYELQESVSAANVGWFGGDIVGDMMGEAHGRTEAIIADPYGRTNQAGEEAAAERGVGVQDKIEADYSKSRGHFP
jgi:hypothetical protein